MLESYQSGCSGQWETTSYYLENYCYQGTIFTCDFSNQQLVQSSYRDRFCNVLAKNYTYSFDECNQGDNLTISCINGYPQAPSNSYSYFIYAGCDGSSGSSSGFPVSIDVSPINECQQNNINTFEYSCNSTDLIYNSYELNSICDSNDVDLTMSWPLKTPFILILTTNMNYNCMVILPNGAHNRVHYKNDITIDQLRDSIVKMIPGTTKDKLVISLSSNPNDQTKIVKAIGWTKFLSIDVVKKQYTLGFIDNAEIEFNDGTDSFIMKLYVTLK
ncbi:hypothetical protein DLAC_10093 [Tieghemostelium lacteum]|uniref:Uncharacterized protein n=1 Tax=Tieghemostelium lacteum TaxID=361077 RepID=A0A151Z645_TIELA|nr:hypothetical protein DLAC_10093 [Tieghemostelium lacteum]|eukprot:KYQ89429.1 hypothetical protein DLAC_10093 [Tieghemostelium lacteum]